MKYLLAILLTALVTFTAEAKEKEIDEQFYGMKTIKCSYQRNVSVNFTRKGFDPSKNDKEDFEITYDSIDFKKGKARLIGNTGAADVFALSGLGALSLLEQTSVGGLNITTIFPDEYPNGAPDEYMSVNSRHIAMYKLGDGGGVASQRYGKCKVIDYRISKAK